MEKVYKNGRKSGPTKILCWHSTLDDLLFLNTGGWLASRLLLAFSPRLKELAFNRPRKRHGSTFRRDLLLTSECHSRCTPTSLSRSPRGRAPRGPSYGFHSI